MSVGKAQVLAGLTVLCETCKAALTTLSTLPRSASTIPSPAAPSLLRSDMVSLNRLIHRSTTRLSVALGKPPASYPPALSALDDLQTHVAQLSTCVASFPQGALRREAVCAAEAVVQALETLAQHFARQDEGGGGEAYLARTGAVHDAAAAAEEVSRDEVEAVVKAWRANGESLEDSLKEVKEMMDEEAGGEEEEGDDGWGELGEGFGGKLSAEEMERVKKVYPLVRLTALLHGRILSHHILKPPASGRHSQAHLASLLQLSDALPPATDELVSALYAPQDAEGIEEAADAVHELTKQCEKEMAAEMGDEEAVRRALEALQASENGAGADRAQMWFKQCFSQIDRVQRSVHLAQPS